MSKKRDLRNRSNVSIHNISLDDRKLRNSSFFGTETIKSKYVPHGKHHQSDINGDLGQYRKDQLFNRYVLGIMDRNISYYRQSFNQNDSSQLPFMSSLRAG